MIDLVSIDPGLECPAAACFSSGKLVATAHAVLLTKAGWREAARHLNKALGQIPNQHDHVLVVELPQVYRTGLRKGDPADLVDLAAMAGAMVGMLDYRVEKLVVYQPHDWKGNLKKAECERRVRARLSPEELAAVTLPERKALAHNVWDAVGIGLRYLNRFGPNS
jgi:hypothetical protein